MSDAPRLARRARVRWDRIRHAHVVVAPEKVLVLSGNAGEVLTLCDGSRTKDQIVAKLVEKHPGAPIERDVSTLFARLAARGLLVGVAESSAAPVDDGDTLPRAGGPPTALLAELTYRCPLQCGYCSNPRDLARYADAMTATDWCRVIDEAAGLGVLQFHFSGGEPLLCSSLAVLVRRARERELYTNLITSAHGLDEARLGELVDAGIDHVQISVQDVDAARADRIAGTTVHAQKLLAASLVKRRGVALSLNVVLHRENVARVGAFVDLADALGAERIELANTQYHGWALANRDALMPSRAALDAAADDVARARERVRGRVEILYVLPDYYTDRPKPCMDGWGRRFITVLPDGTMLPCPGAHTLPLAFDNVRTRSVGWIWEHGEAFDAFRGTAWMREPCSSCERREIDHGGCRCQAFALTGDARNADPACGLSADHGSVVRAREAAGLVPPTVLHRIRVRTSGRGSGESE